jgi:hypothetical protein
MKRKTKLFYSGIILLSALTGCGNDESSNEPQKIKNNTENNSATTDGTTSSIGGNPTNSTGSTGKSVEIPNTPQDTSGRSNNNATTSGDKHR